MQTDADEELLQPNTIVNAGTARLRLLTGLLQGIVLCFLYWSLKQNAWVAASGYTFAPLLLVALLVPVLLISGMGHMHTRTLSIWLLVATIVCVSLGIHDIWRAGPMTQEWFGGKATTTHIIPSGMLVFFLAVGLYIAHALVLAGAADRQRIARYTSYFETAWKLAIQILFSMLFVGVLWLILWLGASLFMLIKLNALHMLLQNFWFNIPISAFAFSTALHLTDVRPNIVRGIRSLLLVLMSWLLPVAALIAGAFLVSLPFTGLEPLWSTRHATSVLLGTAAALIVLINATFQNGDANEHIARVLRVAARIACALLTPVTLIAIYALTLRVQQYGWTADRVVAAACLLVATCYATGYLWAALERNTWLARIASTNVLAALLVLATLLGLFTPVADPVRLAVSSQLARLESGKVNAAQFDFHYLRFLGERYGDEALQRLKSTTTGPDAANVRAAAIDILTKTNRYEAAIAPTASRATRAAGIAVWPAGQALPDSFLAQEWSGHEEDYLLPLCLRQQDRKCEAYLLDLNEDGKNEILLRNRDMNSKLIIFSQETNGRWQPKGMAGFSTTPRCQSPWKELEAGQARLVVPEFRDIEILGTRVKIEPWMAERNNCIPK